MEDIEVPEEEAADKLSMKEMVAAIEKIENEEEKKAFYEDQQKPPKMVKKYEDGGCDLLFVIGTALAVNPFA